MEEEAVNTIANSVNKTKEYLFIYSVKIFSKRFPKTYSTLLLTQDTYLAEQLSIVIVPLGSYFGLLGVMLIWLLLISTNQ